MIDIKLLRDNSTQIQEASLAKGVQINTKHILTIDEKYREVYIQLQRLQEERNNFTKDIHGVPTHDQIIKGREIKEKVEKTEAAVRALKEELDIELFKIPNPAKSDVKIGKDDSENEILRKVGEPRVFSFTPKDHLELGQSLGIIDTEKAGQVSGARFTYLKRDGVLLEFALKQLAFETLMSEGFIPVIPPVLIKNEVMEGLGYTAMGEAENIFSLDKDGLCLVGTSEQSVVPLHMNETLEISELPRRYVSYSTCFRREAGSYGKDTKGIFRVHQFNKVEMVSFVAQGEDDKEHEYLLGLEEKFFAMLNIPYQVLAICSGDLGFNAARKYDIEAWIPTQEKYREVTSASTVTDFQSRRLNMRYSDKGEKKYMSVLNGTAFSMNRPIIAILENYQNEDGSVTIPEVLRKYMGKDKIVAVNK